MEQEGQTEVESDKTAIREDEYQEGQAHKKGTKQR